MSDEQLSPESAPALSPTDAADAAASAPVVEAPTAPAPVVEASAAPAPVVETPAAPAPVVETPAAPVAPSLAEVPAPEEGESAEVPDLTTKRRSAT